MNVIKLKIILVIKGLLLDIELKKDILTNKEELK